MKGIEDQRAGDAPSSRRFLVIAGQQLLGTILAFVVWVLLARMLPVSKFGEFNAAFGVAMMAGTLANLGMAQYVTVPFRSAISTGDFQAARGLRRVVPWCIFGAAMIVYGIILPAHVMFSDASIVRDETFAGILVLLPLIGIMLYLVSTANVHGAPGPAMFLSVPGLQILIGVGLGAAWLIRGEGFDVLDAAAVWVAAMTVICFALWLLNLSVEAADFKNGFGTLAWRSWASGTLPFFLNGTVCVFLVQAPFLVLGWIQPSGRDAAMFAAADRLAQLLAVAGLAGGAMFLPLIADAVHARDYRYCQRLVRRWILLVGTTNLVGVGLLGLFGGHLLDLYGAEYRAAYPLLLVTGSSIGFAMTASVFLSIVQYDGCGNWVIRTSLVWSVIGAGAMLVLGWKWQAMGVAVGQGGAFVGMNIAFVLKARPFLSGATSSGGGGKNVTWDG